MPTTSKHLESLLPLATSIKADLRPRARHVVNVQVAYGFLSKSIQTLRGICLLLNEDLNEEAQALVRVLFETRMGFDHFKQLCQADAREATLLFLDAIVVEKEKQYRAAGYAGPAIVDGIEVRPGIEADLKEVSKRRSEE